MLQNSDRIDILGGCLNTDHPVLKESTSMEAKVLGAK